MEGSASAGDLGAPESWEVADLGESVRKLLLKDTKLPPYSASSPPSSSSSSSLGGRDRDDKAGTAAASASASVSDDPVNQVDQFLREALQNPRERLSVLRMEQDVEKFIRDPTQEQLEFQQLPTSYLRLAAHRVAQHYSLQSMVLLDNSLPDGSGSRIIVRKTSECHRPVVRLADIRVNLPGEESGALKFAIKQRPQKRSPIVNNSTSHSLKANSSKSVEERKEEYNRARARIFNATSSNVSAGGNSDIEPKVQDSLRQGSMGMPKAEERTVPGVLDMNIGRDLFDSTMGSSRTARNRVEKEPAARYRPNNRVAIFRDREVDRKDPDYDRSYDRYMQRFDPGFGFNGGPYTIQPMYSPALNYNTEFPQLGSSHRPQISSDHQPVPLPQHLPGPWATASTASGIGYGHPDTMMAAFNPNHVGARSASSLFLHSSQYPCQQPGMPFIHSHEHRRQTYSQTHQQQPETSFGLARPR